MAAGDPGVLKRNFSATAIETTLVNSISSAATGDTTTSVSVVSVSGFPSVPFTVILAPDTNKEEVVTVTAASSTTLTITRGQDGTQAQSHTAGTSVRHGVSGRDFKEEQTHIAARGYDADTGILSNAGQTHVHGLVTGDGSIVGADQLVTLTRKTLTTPTVNGATLTGTVTATTATIASPTITSPTISGSPVITGLSSAGMSTSSAAPKSYVDALITTNEAYATAAATSAASALTSQTASATSATSAAASATAAATSATSAAASATAAATSAASAAASTSAAAASASAAATSATSAAASATAASTSASSALTSQTAAATSATSAATSATAAATSATSAATSASSALTSQTAAATSATSAAASATNAATSATSASASATAAASSAGTAATSAGQAVTSATSAATSATSAAASATAAATSATSADASATTASNSAATAITQATNAATSATSAATSATSAAASATAAATSATNAAASYDSFDDRYLGAKATAPTVDNDGNALLTGALYWNTAVNKMYVWSGSAWEEISSSADIIAYKYTVTAAATSVSGADDNGLTLTYTVGKEQVYINGVLQVRGSDYTATTGSSITGMAAMLADDIVTVLAFTAFVVANTYTQAEADAKFFQTANAFLAGKNKIINGDFNVNQRGFTSTTTSGTYGFDRWLMVGTGGTVTYSSQAFTPGTAPVVGYEAKNYAQVVTASQSAAGDRGLLVTRIENARNFANQPVVISFWAKAASGTPKIGVEVAQDFGTGGSPSSFVSNAFGSVTLSTSWVRYSVTATMASISGKTFGTDNNNFLSLGLWVSAGADFATRGQSIGVQNNTFDIWGVQVEAGSIATPFQTATGTIQGELAACQRYYFRKSGTAAYQPYSNGFNYGTTQANLIMALPVTMRTSPTMGFSAASTFVIQHTSNLTVPTAIAGDRYHPDMVQFYATVASGLTAGQAVGLNVETGQTGFIEMIAEL
jgi:hypothetical protein